MNSSLKEFTTGVKKFPKAIVSGGLMLYGAIAFLLASGGFAAYEIEKMTTKIKISAVEKGVARVSVSKSPVTALEYNSVVVRVQNISPGVEFKVLPDSLEVFGKNQEAYPDWMFALMAIPTIDERLRWQIDEICIGAECPSGLVYARLKAMIHKVENNR